MSKIEEPLEAGWLGQVMRDVRNEVATWPPNSSYPKTDIEEPTGNDAPKNPSDVALNMK
jgi:hypothetical protein